MLSAAALTFISNFTQRNKKKTGQGFSQDQVVTMPPPSGRDMIITSVLVSLFYIILTSIIGKFLWNGSARKLLPFLAKCESPATIVGLQVLISILIGGFR